MNMTCFLKVVFAVAHRSDGELVVSAGHVGGVDDVDVVVGIRLRRSIDAAGNGHRKVFAASRRGRDEVSMLKYFLSP